ncbi:MAG: GtrA family protein [Candidatus Paceibacterota bacterium]
MGGINTVVDFGILNTLMFISKIYSGFWFAFFRALSFVVANINSYFLNKRWTFQKKEKLNFYEFLKFFSLSLVGLFLNVSISYYLTTFNPPFNLSAAIWANLSAFSGSCVTTFFNFFSYRFLIFKD